MDLTKNRLFLLLTFLVSCKGKALDYACCCFYYVKTKEAQDYHPLGDHGFPLGNNQGLLVSYAFKILAG